MATAKLEHNQKALIFDIERFSTKDGPGIRTVVFFKGCNMRCYWCHNPEGIEPKVSLRFDESKCIGCISCVHVCKSGAHSFSDNHHLIDSEKCQSSFACAGVCYSGALQIVGKYMDADEVLAEIAEDQAFYQRSGGGVTLSGGEVMLQSNFIAHLLAKCRENGIHTAIETNLSLPWSEYEKVLPVTDLVMADIKHMDDTMHRRGTGISNQRVLSNLQRIVESGKPLIIRTPVISGFNDSQENIRNTALFLKSIQSLGYYELLSYNPLGNAKGLIVGRKFVQQEIAVPTKGEMRDLARVAVETGIKVFVDGHEFSIAI